MAPPHTIRARKKLVEAFEDRPPIYIDTPEGPRLIEQEAGEKLNFLYDALLQARATKTSVDVAEKDLYTELSDYYGVVLRKEANKRGWSAPGVDSDALSGKTGYREDIDAPPRLDKLLPGTVRYDAAHKVFFALDTFSGKSKFHTWAYAIMCNVIMDAITHQINTRASKASGAPLHDPAATAQGARGGKMTKNVEEIKTIRRLDREKNARMSEEEFHAKMDAYYNLLEQQSKTDRRFIELVLNSPKGSNRAIARQMRWSIKKVYNRAAKFKNLGLLPILPANLRKREYNRRYRQKLAMRN